MSYVKTKYGEKVNLCYTDTDRWYLWMIFMTHKKTDDIYKDMAEDVETRFDISNYELNRALSKWKNKKVIGVVKDELGKNHERICCIKSKNVLGSEDKKAKAI